MRCDKGQGHLEVKLVEINLGCSFETTCDRDFILGICTHLKTAYDLSTTWIMLDKGEGHMEVILAEINLGHNFENTYDRDFILGMCALPKKVRDLSTTWIMSDKGQGHLDFKLILSITLQPHVIETSY